MITEKEFAIIESYARLVTRDCTLNAKWDEQLKILRERGLRNRKFKYMVHLAVLAMVVAVAIHGGSRLISITVTKSVHVSPEILVMYVLIQCTYTAMSLLVLSFSSLNEDLLVLFNQLVNFSHGARNGGWVAGGTGNREKYFMLFQRLYNASAGGFACFLFVFEAHYVWTTTSSFLLTGVVPLMAVLAFRASTLLIAFAQMYLFMYFAIINATVKKFVERMNKIHWTEETVNHMTGIYKSVTIISNQFNQTYCKFIVPNIKFGGCGIAMMAAVAAIRLRNLEAAGSTLLPLGLLSVVLYLNAMVILASKMSSSIWEISTAYIWKFKHYMETQHGDIPATVGTLYHSWKLTRNLITLQLDSQTQAHRDLKKYMCRVSKTLLPLRFSIGGLYYMEKEAKLTLVAFIINGTTDVLLAFGGKGL